jgi:hypothetical protein
MLKSNNLDLGQCLEAIWKDGSIDGKKSPQLLLEIAG